MFKSRNNEIVPEEVNQLQWSHLMSEYFSTENTLILPKGIYD